MPENVKSEARYVQETLSEATSTPRVATEGRAEATVGSEATAEVRVT